MQSRHETSNLTEDLEYAGL